MSQPLEYDRGSAAYRLPLDTDADGSIGTAIAMGVAALEGADEADLPTLHEAVDADAIEALLASGRGASPPPGVVVEFPYAGYRVTARSGEILLHARDTDSA